MFKIQNSKTEIIRGLATLLFTLATIQGSPCGAEQPPKPSNTIRSEPVWGGHDFDRIEYHHPGLVVDLGVGLWAWPLPMDYDGDGDYDLLVSCPDVPSGGTYFFENPGQAPGVSLPVFRRAVRLGPGLRNAQVSFVDGRPRVLECNVEYVDIPAHQLNRTKRLPLPRNIHPNKVRANQWKVVDYDDDGCLDLIIGVGDWTDYGWDNAFDAEGRWTRGPLHGFVYLVRNAGTSENPKYDKPRQLEASGEVIDTYGMPSPNLADFDGDGDLDLLCGDFVDTFTYFQNVGTRSEPCFESGRVLKSGSEPLQPDSPMFVPVAIDWDRDGDTDLVVGQEDGRVMLFAHTGQVVDGMPQFKSARFFQQEADAVKFGALSTPVGYDWDGDGDEDLICGNAAGRIGWIENLGGFPPRWAAPVRLSAAGKTIRIQAGPNGSIQGPCEAKWGYTTLSVADWDQDGLADLMVNSIWGKILWYRNLGTRHEPKLAAAEPLEVSWLGKPPKPAWNWWQPEGNSLATQWRTTPQVIDFNGDGLNDLVMLDAQGDLALFERAKRAGKLVLLAPRYPLVDEKLKRLHLAKGTAGRSGRRKFCFADWDLDGRKDLLLNDQNVNFWRNLGARGNKDIYQDLGPVADRRLAGHTSSPTTVDWDGNGVPDLLVGAEDGFFYYLKNPK
jgi:hypothetical protein